MDAPAIFKEGSEKMNRKNACFRYAASLLLLLFAGATSSALAQGTAFSYQGRLQDSGANANGNYDFQFTLWDASSGGTQQPQPTPLMVTKSGVAVANGVFTVQLDFGPTAFPGADRWLETSVRLAGAGAFTVLSPRQPITSTPYAVRSASSSSADVAATATNVTQLGGVAANQYVVTTDPRMSDPRAPTAGSANYIQNSASAQASSNFNISGNGTAGGTLSGNIVNAATQYSISGNRVLTAGNIFSAVGQNVFVGFGSGQANTNGSFNAYFGSSAGLHSNACCNSMFGDSAGVKNTTGQYNSFFGDSSGSSNTTESSNTFIGAFTDGAPGINNSTALGYNTVVTQSNSLVLGNNVNVGIGTTAPAVPLEVRRNSTVASNWQTGQLRISGASDPNMQLSLGYDTSSNLGVIQAGQAFTGFKTLSLNPSGGAVGIGTTGPDQTLTVNGGASKPGGGSWATFSDERLKNIKGRFTPGLNPVMRLQPIRYQYKADNALGIKSEGEHIGFGAQAVQKVLPEAVTRDEKGFLLVNNDPILWTMLNAVKEQQAQIEQQKKALEHQQELIKQQTEQFRQQSAMVAAQQQQIEALKKLVCRSNRRSVVCR
jgi:Chaperone of endosialidase